MNKFQFFESFGEIDPAFVTAVDELLAGEGPARPAFRRKKVLGAALLAAVLAALLTATAYAAGLFQLSVQVPQRGETQSYSLVIVEPDGELLRQTAEETAGLILHFDSQREGTLCAFRPGWLPVEPTRAESLEEKAGDLARARLGMAFPASGEREQAQEAAETEKVLEEMGLSAEEAARWSVWCEADPAQGPEPGIPYQMALSNCSDLYELDLLIGSDGDAVELLKDETAGEERTLWIRVSKEPRPGEPESADALFPYQVALRFSQAEGWLLSVTGTLDAETLGKIAEDTEIRQTAFPTESQRTERGFGSVLLARG